MNEPGVASKQASGRPDEISATAGPELVPAEGSSVDGSRFPFAAGHFGWLLRFAGPLGFGFDRLGKRRPDTPATRLTGRTT